MNEISKEQLLYMKRTRQHKQFVLFFQLFLFIFFIILWEITSRAGIINAFIFSSPSRMLASGKELLLNGQLLKHLGITLAETFASFFLVTAVSLFTAILLWWNNTIRRHKNRPVKLFKFFLLLPPCISIIAYKIRILFKCWV